MRLLRMSWVPSLRAAAPEEIGIEIKLRTMELYRTEA
jgi:hypothetical protein